MLTWLTIRRLESGNGREADGGWVGSPSASVAGLRGGSEARDIGPGKDEQVESHVQAEGGSIREERGGGMVTG